MQKPARKKVDYEETDVVLVRLHSASNNTRANGWLNKHSCFVGRTTTWRRTHASSIFDIGANLKRFFAPVRLLKNDVLCEVRTRWILRETRSKLNFFSVSFYRKVAELLNKPLNEFGARAFALHKRAVCYSIVVRNDVRLQVFSRINHKVLRTRYKLNYNWGFNQGLL